MAFQQAIITPSVYARQGQNRQETVGGEYGLPDGGNTFLAKTFLYLSSGNLTLVPSSTTASGTSPNISVGFTPDASAAVKGVTSGNISTAPWSQPQLVPYDLFGQFHWPFALSRTRFLINLGHLSGGTTGSLVLGSDLLSAVTVGSSYNISTATTGTYTGRQFCDPTLQTFPFFTIVEIPTLRQVAQSSGALTGQFPTGQPGANYGSIYNGIVVVEVVGASQQNLM